MHHQIVGVSTNGFKHLKNSKKIFSRDKNYEIFVRTLWSLLKSDIHVEPSHFWYSRLILTWIVIFLVCVWESASVSTQCYLCNRMKHEKETSSSILVQHLSFADMLMGIYLLIVVGGDQYYRYDEGMPGFQFRKNCRDIVEEAGLN